MMFTKRHKSQKKIDVMEDIDSVPSNVQAARQEALLYVFWGQWSSDQNGH